MAGPVKIVTANFGGFDRLRPQAEQDIPVEWVAYADRPQDAPDPWQLVIEKPRFKDFCRSAKVFKCLPDRQPYIWIDANMEVTSPSFAREALAACNQGIAVYPHPRRDCIYAEAEASLGAEGQNGKYADQPIAEQMASYLAGGHPNNGGLYACGVVAWDGADPKFGPYWMAECVRWSIQDQLSFPVVCRRLGVNPGTFDHPQIQGRENGYLWNRWLRIHPHL